jgi:hypothetical protein
MALSKIEILTEVGISYTLDTRSTATGYFDQKRNLFIRQGDCVYHTTDGRHCGIGRFMMPRYRILDETALFSYAPEDLGDGVLVEEVRGHCKEFWRDVMMLHDTEENWGEQGLTETGKDHLNALLCRWG